jgi:hypothetical protein
VPPQRGAFDRLLGARESDAGDKPERRCQNHSEMLFDLEHPDQVLPCHAEGQSLCERNPLRFYRTGFYVLLALVVTLLRLLLKR